MSSRFIPEDDLPEPQLMWLERAIDKCVAAVVQCFTELGEIVRGFIRIC